MPHPLPAHRAPCWACGRSCTTSPAQSRRMRHPTSSVTPCTGRHGLILAACLQDGTAFALALLIAATTVSLIGAILGSHRLLGRGLLNDPGRRCIRSRRRRLSIILTFGPGVAAESRLRGALHGIVPIHAVHDESLSGFSPLVSRSKHRAHSFGLGPWESPDDPVSGGAARDLHRPALRVSLTLIGR